ncbi:MAG: ubiquinol-cytochrome c reductase iron-sulfur subunit [Dehalococcoidales bacterium]|nr:ubiquinol-cytochrome c reductase iron-sulfur subunit [Dehalococcoidales bacterium]
MEQPPNTGRQRSRRGFLHWGIVAVGGIFSLMIAAPVVGYLFDPWFRSRPEIWVRVTSLDEIDSVFPREYRVAFTRTDFQVNYEDVRGVFVIRRGEEILAFSNICTHMECRVRWLNWRQQILCPCHGGLYDRWGQLMGGPPAHSLPLYQTKIIDNDLYIADQTVFRV